MLPVSKVVSTFAMAFVNNRLFIYMHLKEDTTYNEKVKTLVEIGQSFVNLRLQDK